MLFSFFIISAGIACLMSKVVSNLLIRITEPNSTLNLNNLIILFEFMR